MRHRVFGRRLGRNSAQRKALFRNLVRELYLHERIVTTDISAPVNGMRLRLNNAPVAPAAESQSGQDKVRGENQ